MEEKGSTDRRITVLSTIRFRPTAVDNLKTIACEAQHPALTGGALTASLQIFVQCKQNFLISFLQIFSVFAKFVYFLKYKMKFRKLI